MRIGIFGGSFDPVHLGHLLVGEICRDACQLDELRFVPASLPPHKMDQDRAPAAQRIEMLNLATAGNSRFSVWDVEIQRGGVSYTVDTLTQLRQQCPDDELFLLMGADSLHDLPNWREPNRICELACLVVVQRAGSEPVHFRSLSKVVSEKRIKLFEQHVVPMPILGISSSEIRQRVASGRTIRYQTPPAVEQYVAHAGLYLA